ncbi:MAG: ribokinase, partial [Roseiflexaceae bacterium]|nr:ribokinase [Roseiflexaceae bacterium]
MTPRITVVGSTNIDMMMRLADLPAPGETVAGGVFLQAFGGKGANQAVAAARLGGSVTFISCLGDDTFAAQLIASFQQAGIETSQIRRSAEAATGTALILVDQQGENAIALAPGANALLSPAHIDEAATLIGGSALVLLQMEISEHTVARTLALAQVQGVPVLLNYAPVRGQPLPLSTAITTLVVNETEAERLCGLSVRTIDQAQQAAAALLAKGPQRVVITLGAGGVYIATGDAQTHVPALPVTPIDTTAAGDCFCGALAVALVEGLTDVAAARFASAAAAISVTRIGAQPSLPSRAEVEQ